MSKAAIALFDAVLWLCPGDLRRRYGGAMRHDFVDELRASQSVWTSLTFALAAYADVIGTAIEGRTASVRRDLAFTARSIRKAPGFTLVVVGTLALAIGANTAVFSVLRSVVLAPLPYPDADRIVVLEGLRDGEPFGFSLPDYADLHDRSTSFVAAGASVSYDIEHVLEVDGIPHTVSVAGVTPGFFEVFGLAPQLGRYFSASDARPGASPSLVISERFWRTYLHANPAIVGTTLRLEQTTYRIIGVAPARFSPAGIAIVNHDAWSAFPEHQQETVQARGSHYYDAVARLRPGATPAGTRAELQTIFAALRVRYPGTDTHYGVAAIDLLEATVGNIRPTLLAIFGAVAGVFLVACANVSNLLLGRASAREQELVVRLALGASRRRIVTQLLTETLVFACAGGAIGIGLAYVAVDAFVKARPSFVPRVADVSVDGWTIGYTVGIVVIATLAAGIWPALSLSRRNLAATLKRSGRSGDASGGSRARTALVVFEIACTLALVIVAGLIVRSYGTLTSRPLGFTAQNLTVAGPVELSSARYQTPAGRQVYFDRALASVRAIPGVREASWAFDAPFVGNAWNEDFTIVGVPKIVGTELAAHINTIGPQYFAAVGSPLREGRAFTSDDRRSAAPVAIVNEAFVRAFLHGRSAIGTRLSQGTIVGVAADSRNSFTTVPLPTLYLPIEQSSPFLAVLLVRGAPRVDLNDAIAVALARVDPHLVAPDVAPLQARIERSSARTRLTMQTLSLLAGVALALSLVGIFAIVSFGVAQRTREFGIRIALGAPPRAILYDVVVRAMRVTGIGIAIGIVIAAIVGQLLGGMLVDVSPLDPATFVAVVALVCVATLCAALIPARRALRVDPVVALRVE